MKKLSLLLTFLIMVAVTLNLKSESLTPSVLYVIDSNHDLNNPVESSWAGKFIKPHPTERPNYYADDCGTVEWNYKNPCDTWHNHVVFRDYAKSTLEARRPEMYDALLKKLNKIYK